MESSALRSLTFLLLPRGRIGRAEFWMGLFLHIWVLRKLAVPQAVMALAAGVLPSDIGWIAALLAIVDFWLVWCHLAKRWHDMNLAAIWTLGLFVPALGPTIGFLALGFIPGSKGVNRYGAPRPLRVTFDELRAALYRADRLATPTDPAPADPLPVAVPAPAETPQTRRAAVATRTPPPISRRGEARFWGPRSPDRSSTSVVVRRRR